MEVKRASDNSKTEIILESENYTLLSLPGEYRSTVFIPVSPPIEDGRSLLANPSTSVHSNGARESRGPVSSHSPEQHSNIRRTIIEGETVRAIDGILSKVPFHTGAQLNTARLTRVTP